MSPRPRIALAAFLIGLLGACAGGTPINVVSSGALPDTGSFQVVRDEGGDVPAYLRDVAAHLERRGLHASDAGGYLLQAALAERPDETGLYVPEQASDEWLRPPAGRKSRRPVRTLVVSLSDKATGREIYRLVASTRRPGVDAAALLDAAFTSPPPASLHPGEAEAGS